MDKQRECQKWLKEYIKANPDTAIRRVYADGKEASYTKADIKHARSTLGAKLITAEVEVHGVTLYMWKLASK